MELRSKFVLAWGAVVATVVLAVHHATCGNDFLSLGAGLAIVLIVPIVTVLGVAIAMAVMDGINDESDGFSDVL